MHSDARAATAIDRASIKAMLMLRVIRGLGDVRVRALLERHGTVAAALRAGLAEFASPGEHANIEERAEHALAVSADLGARIVVQGNADYPDRLMHLHDPPAVLFARGDVDLLGRPAVAIVGSRRHTEYGADVCSMLAGGLARAGVVIISGLAHGIDRIAHEATLEASSDTIAVVGSGIDIAYPRAHEQLQERIARYGLLLSEFLPGEPALPDHFPRRNRIIAALARAVIVVEASETSGALITARHAADLGRTVFAVPGPIGRPTSHGTNELLRDGAAVVLDVDDVLHDIKVAPAESRPRHEHSKRRRAPSPRALEGDAKLVWAALSHEPQHVDEIAASANLATAAALAVLLSLELEGHVRQVPGMRFGRSASWWGGARNRTQDKG
jgi:DNA processing protein